MEKYNDDTVMFSSLLSGILLFKKEVDNNEILNIMYHYERMYNIDVIDDELPNIIYCLVNMNDKGVSINPSLDYNSIISINGKKVTLGNYLRRNTNGDIMDFLETYVFCSKPVGLKGSIYLFNNNNKKRKIREKKELKGALI